MVGWVTSCVVMKRMCRRNELHHKGTEEGKSECSLAEARGLWKKLGQNKMNGGQIPQDFESVS